MKTLLLAGGAIVAVLVVALVMIDSMSESDDGVPDPGLPTAGREETATEPVPGIVRNRVEEEALGGTVTDLAGKPLADASVTVHPFDEETGLDTPKEPALATVGTDGKGRFGVPDAPSGDWVLEVRRPGYAREYRIVRSFVATERVRVVVRLRPRAEISGTVVTVTGEPIPGAVLTLVPSRARASFFRRGQRTQRLRPRVKREIESGAAGGFVFSDLRPGAYDILVVAPEMVPRNLFTVHAPTADREVILRRGQTLTGTITWPSGIEPKSLHVKTEPSTSVAKIERKEHGAVFIIEGMPPGTYDITAYGRGTSAPRLRIRLADGKAPPLVTLELASGTVVAGTVTDQDTGRPIPGAEVRFEHDGVVQTGMTDATGQYRMLLAPGSWESAAGKDNYHDPARDGRSPSRIEVSSGNVQRDFRLRTTATIVGRVLYPDGLPARARIEVTKATAIPGSSAGRSALPPRGGGGRTSRDGSYRIDGVVVWAIYELRAVGPGPENFALLEDVAFPEGQNVVEVPDMVVQYPPIDREDPSRGTVRGTVRDERTQPVPGAVVLIDERITTADENGNYEIAGVRPGRRAVHAMATGFPPTRFESVRCRAGRTTEASTLILPNRGVAVAIRVLDTDAQPIPYARIDVRFSGVSEKFELRCDAFGHGELEGPSVDQGVRVTVTAAGVGFAPNAVTTTVVTERVIDVELQRFALLFGTLRASGPSPRILVAQYRSDASLPWSSAQVLVGRTGREFVSDEFPAGEFDVRLSAPGFTTADLGRLKFHPGRTTNAGVVSLVVGGTIRGSVYYQGRRAGPGLRVEIQALGRSTRTDTTGGFEMKNVPPGPWTVTVRPPRPGFPPGTATVTVKDEAVAKVVLKIER